MSVVGPGAARQVEQNVRPLLEGASEYEYVTIKNPLEDDFAIRVAQDIPMNLPFNIGKDTSGKVNQLTNSEQDAKQIYGLSLKNPDFVSKKHVINDTIIPAGKTINLKGNEAQVAVKQLVDEILQRQGKKRLLADPTLRKEVEEAVIVSRGSIQDILENSIQTPRQQIDEALSKSNEAVNDPFPGLNQTDSKPKTSKSKE